jgi:hypothetical protein
MNPIEMLKLIHFYYIRYHCYTRSARPLFSIIEDVAKNGLCIFKQLNGDNAEIDDEDKEGETDSRLFSNEEIVLSKIFNLNSTSPFELESTCWELQDIPYILDGKKVGGNTINDFLDYISKDDRENAKKDMGILCSDFKTLFDNEDNFKKVKSLLLFYCDDNGSSFWQRQSPYYYFNFECSLKKRKDLERNNIILSIIIPTVFHGIYDFCAMSGYKGFVYVFIVFVIYLYIVTIKKLKEISTTNQEIRKEKQFCPKCGYKVDVNKFCNHCGTRV